MSPLLARMTEDMTLAGLALGTQKLYAQAVYRLAAHYRRAPDRLSEERGVGLPARLAPTGGRTRHLQDQSFRQLLSGIGNQVYKLGSPSRKATPNNYRVRAAWGQWYKSTPGGRRHL
jgi:hypothetical protein